MEICVAKRSVYFRRAHVNIKEQGQHQFIADIDLVLLLIPLIQSCLYLLS